MAGRKELAVREEDNSKVPTIYMALDLGRRRWTVGIVLPGDRHARLFQIVAGDREALSVLIQRQREAINDPGVRVVSCYEAGRDGFWLTGACGTSASKIERWTRRASRRRGVGGE